MLTGFARRAGGGLPAVGALAALLAGVAAVAPDAFTVADTCDADPVRLGAPLLPFLILFVVALLAGQAFGGTALRVAHQAPEARVTTVLSRGRARCCSGAPWGALGVVLGGLLLDLAAAGRDVRPAARAVGPDRQRASTVGGWRPRGRSCCC